MDLGSIKVITIDEMIIWRYRESNMFKEKRIMRSIGRRFVSCIVETRMYVFCKEFLEYQKFKNSFHNSYKSDYGLASDCLYRNEYYNDRNRLLVQMCRNEDADGISEWYATSDSDKMYYDEYYEHRMSMRIIAKYIKKNVPRSARILDVACGHGSVDRRLTDYGFEVKGIDLNEERIRELEPYIHEVETIDIARMTTQRQYDVLISLEMLEHVPNVNKTLLKMKELLKQGGLLFVSVPNEKMIDDEQHVRLFDRDSLMTLAQNAGFKVMACCLLPYLNNEKNNDVVCVCTKL